jgi:AraC-like DNA-binding protein
MGIGRAGGVVALHSHHAFQISLPLEGEIRLAGTDQVWQNYRGAMVRADDPHAFDGNHSTVAMIFVDPESHEGRWLRHTLRAPITAVSESRLERCIPLLQAFWEDPPDASETATFIQSLVRNLCAGPAPNRQIDTRITRAIEFIRVSDVSTLLLDDVASQVHLSSSRFAHLFSQEIGLPFRRYLLWRKLTHAILMVGRGDTLSAAAHGAGFSDSAHLTRTFYQMFGIPPTIMMGGGQFYEIPAPFESSMPARAAESR